MSWDLPLQHNSLLPADLLALSDLSPPSPVSSPTELNTSWSWSDVKIELDFNVDNEDEDPSRFLHNASNGRSGLCILPSSSTSTACSTGTFGPSFKRHLRASGAILPECHSTISGCSRLSLVTNDSNHGSLFDSQNNVSLDSSLNSSSTSIIKPLASDTSPSILSRSISPDTAPNMITSGQESPPSPTLSKISGISPSCTETLFFSLNDSSPGSTSLGYKDQSTGLNVYARQLAIAATLATLGKKCPSEPSSPMAKCTESGPGCSQLSNTSLTTVELLIDQEGFRSVLARFKHAGLIPDPYSDDDNDAMAHFRPIKRQTFRFHYAALEALPVLRRITVNGEESRDYTSRQASLSLRTNGVYFVRGDETPCFTVPGKADSTSKLRWRFEYVVDVKHDASGTISNGERTVTPLSFSCSPLLLHPLQGKRVRLVHVMKKSVVPKLVAQKMEPPNLLGTSSHASPVATARATPSSMSCRTQRYSYDSHKRMALWIPNPTDTISISTGDVYGKFASYRRRRRRASSAGERSLPSASPVASYVHHLPPRNSALCQNIVPPSCLASLVDTDGNLQKKDDSPLSGHSNNPACSFQPLSPSPRHHSPSGR